MSNDATLTSKGQLKTPASSRCRKPMALIGEHRLQLPHPRRQPDDQTCRRKSPKPHQLRMNDGEPRLAHARPCSRIAISVSTI